MKLTVRITRQHGGTLQVLLITAALLVGALGWVGFAVAKSLRPVGTLPDLGSEVVNKLDLATSKEIQVTAPPLLFTLAGWAARWTDLEPEIGDAVRAVHSARVGVYELIEPVSRRTQIELLESTDRSLGSPGWERVLCAIDGREMALVYLSKQNQPNQRVEVCLVVLSDCNLVVVSACGRPDSLSGLIRLAVSKAGLPEMVATAQ